jgi:anti-anti-sigma factor
VAGLSVDAQWHNGQAVLILHGDLDLETRSILRDAGTEQLATPGLPKLTLDLADLSFLDSSGVGVLVELHNQANENGVAMDLVAVPPSAARVLTIGGLAPTFGLPLDETDC